MIYKKNAKIIIVDDEKDTCELLKDILEAENFIVSYYVDSQKFVEDFPKLDHNNLDLVIVDLMMPKFDGFQIMNLLNSKESTRYIPKIVISAFQSKDNLKDAYDYGAIQFIEKPFSIEHVVYQVKTLLRIKLYEDNSRCIIELLQDKNKKLVEELKKGEKSGEIKDIASIEDNLEVVSKLIKDNYLLIENYLRIIQQKYPEIVKGKEMEIIGEIEKNAKNLFDKRVDLEIISNFVKKNFNCFE